MERFFQVFLLTLLLCEVIISYSSVAATEENSGLLKSDESSLVALKSLITSDPHNMLKKNWSSEASVCNWVGVACDSRRRRVIELDISYMGVVGSIPPEIGNMSSLVSLDMRGNFLHGSIPPSIFNISSLESILLGNNSLSGRLSSDMICSGNRLRLRVLHLSWNKFYGEIPLSLHQCSQLEEIHLGYNNFGGHKLGTSHCSSNIPTEICRLNNLEELSMWENKLNGSVPAEMGNLTALRYFDIGTNFFSGTIPEHIGNLNNLEMLYMANNELSGSLPRQIWNITTLTEIYLSQNSLSGLCGFPLTRKCKEKNGLPMPPQEEEEEEGDDSDFVDGCTWRSVALGYGCGLVVGIGVRYCILRFGRPKWLVELFFGARYQMKRRK